MNSKTVHILQVDDSADNLLQVVVETQDAGALQRRIEELLHGDLTARVVPWVIRSEDEALKDVKKLLGDLDDKEEDGADEYPTCEEQWHGGTCGNPIAKRVRLDGKVYALCAFHAEHAITNRRGEEVK